MNVFRILGRVVSALFVALVLFIFVGEGVSDGFPKLSELSPAEGLLFVLLFLSVAGLIVAWWREGVGGWLAIGAALTFIVVNSVAVGAIRVGWVFASIGLTGLLFILSDRQLKQTAG